jgi:hypothetical protein
MNADELAKLINEEFAVATFIPLATALAPFRVTPFVRKLVWPYSKDRPELPCWIFADLSKMAPGLTLAYSEAGHGSYGDHWGIVRTADDHIAGDDHWFLRLEDAFINAGAWDQPLPENYEIR